MSFVTDPVFEEHVFAPAPSPINPIVSGFEVEYAIAQTADRWLPVYLAEAERQRRLEPGALPTPLSVVTSTDASRFPEEQLPSVVVSSEGLEGTPDVRGDGLYSARWRVDVTAICSAEGNRQARRLAQTYAAVLRALAIQRTALEDTGMSILGVDWRGESYRTRAPEAERTRAEATTQLYVHVAAVLYRYGGPLGTVRDVDVITKKQEAR